MDTVNINSGVATAIADTDLVTVADSAGSLKPISFANLMKAVRAGIQVGGRNLLKDSGTPVTSSNYHIKDYQLTENLAVGDKVIVSLWGNLGEGKSHFQAIFGGGDSSYGGADLYKVSDGVYRGTLTVLKVPSSAKFNFYTRPQSPSADCSIIKVKVERGNIATDWSPAPEDLGWGGVIGLLPITYNSAEKGGAHDDQGTGRSDCGFSGCFVSFGSLGALEDFIQRACEIEPSSSNTDDINLLGCRRGDSRMDEDCSIHDESSQRRQRRIYSNALLRRYSEDAVLLSICESFRDMGEALHIGWSLGRLESGIAERKEVAYADR